MYKFLNHDITTSYMSFIKIANNNAPKTGPRYSCVQL